MNLKSWLLSLAVFALAAVHLIAQEYAVLHSFTDMPDGKYPWAGLTAGGDTLYGTTIGSGTQNPGTVWKMKMDGSGYVVLKSFTSADGTGPYACVTLDGTTLYGVTAGGGSANVGTLYKLNTDGTGFTVLKQFNVSDGVNPHSALVTDGTVLYGTTEDARIFKINKDGTGYAILRTLTAAEGISTETSLVREGNTLFGAAQEGGNGGGTLFRINTDGSGFVVLKQFRPGEGTSPYGLLLDRGILYGMTMHGGTNGNFGVVYRINSDGSDYVVLRHFSGTDGSSPSAIMQVVGDVLLGTAAAGGGAGHGVIFQMKTNGTAFNIIKELSGYDHYAGPVGSMALQGNVLYGTTYVGGAFDLGAVYKITVPSLPPVIVSSLTNLVVAGGSRVVQSLALNGTPPFAWQWLCNGTNLDGATHALLTLTDFSPANVGSYSVTVSNPFGVVTSPSFSISSVDIQMFAGVVVNGLVGSNYVIQASDNLAGDWTVLTNLALPAQPYVYIDYRSSANRQQFYRAVPQ